MVSAADDPTTAICDVGRYWADVTPFVIPGKVQKLEMMLPGHTGQWDIKQGALLAGNDLLSIELGSLAEAEAKCKAIEGCVGFTYQKVGAGSEPCSAGLSKQSKVYFKSALSGNSDPMWCSVVTPASIVGIYFENVQTIYTSAFIPAEPAPRSIDDSKL